MNIKRIAIIFLVIVVLIAGLLIILQKNKAKKVTPMLKDIGPSVEQQLREKFTGLKIPNDTEKIELKNVSGGEGIGIATRSEIIADLPELSGQENYQVFVSNGDKTIFLGNLKEAKGGWILEFDISKFKGYNQIIVTNGQKHILEGSF